MMVDFLVESGLIFVYEFADLGSMLVHNYTSEQGCTPGRIVGDAHHHTATHL